MLLELEHRLVLVSLEHCMILDMFVLASVVVVVVACMLAFWVGYKLAFDDVLEVVGCTLASFVVEVPYMLVSWEPCTIAFVELCMLVS